jgi:hypothetical protein
MPENINVGEIGLKLGNELLANGSQAAVKTAISMGLNAVPIVGGILSFLSGIIPWKGRTQHPDEPTRTRIAMEIRQKVINTYTAAGLNLRVEVDGKPLYNHVRDKAIALARNETGWSRSFYAQMFKNVGQGPWRGPVDDVAVPGSIVATWLSWGAPEPGRDQWNNDRAIVRVGDIIYGYMATFISNMDSEHLEDEMDAYGANQVSMILSPVTDNLQKAQGANVVEAGLQKLKENPVAALIGIGVLVGGGILAIRAIK